MSDRAGALVLQRLRALAYVETESALTDDEDLAAIARVRRLSAEFDLQLRGFSPPPSS